MKGGADTGFRQVKPEEYTPRLLHFSGTRRHVEVREVSRATGSLKSGDVFILDMGNNLFQWNGSGSNKDERMKVSNVFRQMWLLNRFKLFRTSLMNQTQPCSTFTI